MTVDACDGVMSTLSGDGGVTVVDTQGSVRSGIRNASMQIKGLLSNAQRSAPDGAHTVERIQARSR